MKIKKNIPLKKYSTFRIGGPARFFVEVRSLEELKEAIKWAQKKKVKFMILGQGSNILFHDKGFSGLIIKVSNNKIELKEGKIHCQAGAMLGKIVSFATKNSLTGMEWAIGIPGTLGGAIRGNAGAFGSEMQDVVQKVIYFDLKKSKKFECRNKECQFDYRKSVFKEFDNKIIWKAVLQLKLGDKKKIQEKVKSILRKRQEKQSGLVKFGSVGSIFKNPIVSKKIVEEFEKETGKKAQNNQVSAGWLIDMCGMRGYKLDGVQVSEEQANFILNTKKGTAESVVILISLIKQKVRNYFGVQLEEEVEIVDY